MPKAYAIINFKGGVGKTTFTWLIGKYLQQFKKLNVLLFDLDPQMSLTLGLTLNSEGRFIQSFQDWYIERNKKKETIFYLLEYYYKNNHFNDLVLNHYIFNDDGIFIIPSNEKLYLTEIMNYERKKFKNIIKDLIEKLYSIYKFDIVLFDCPPNFTNLTYSVFEYINNIIIPCNPDIYARKGLELLILVLELLKRNIKMSNDNYNMYTFMNKTRLFNGKLTTESKHFIEELQNFSHRKFKLNYNYQIKVLNTFIPERIDIKNALENHIFPSNYDYYFELLSQEIGII